MKADFTVSVYNNGNSITLINTIDDYVLTNGHSLRLKMTGEINGVVADLVLNAGNVSDFIAKTPVDLSASDLSAGKYLVLPDDFYSLQLIDSLDSVDKEFSSIVCIATYSYVRKLMHDKIVHTDRMIGLKEKDMLHEQLIHFRALEILGNNPTVTMKDAVIARLTYLKTL